MRTRLCIQPDVAGFWVSFLVDDLGNTPIVLACRIPASTMGTPVRPAVQASKCSGFDSHCTSAYSPGMGAPLKHVERQQGHACRNHTTLEEVTLEQVDMAHNKCGYRSPGSTFQRQSRDW